VNGLDLFSGIGGLSLALEPWVRPIAYCESDRYAQANLLSRMRSGELTHAPIWDDVRTLQGDSLGSWVDIIYGGFPCQDLSTAGRKAGLRGKRSGLFYEITRLTQELQPSFVFLENIAQGINKFEQQIADEFTQLNYTARAIKMSAFDVGANHERLRWFCLAYPNSLKLRESNRRERRPCGKEAQEYIGTPWWTREPRVQGVAHGIPFRVDRLRGLGNAVVPVQAREAFMRLAGLK